jgi:hypothetical protein
MKIIKVYQSILKFCGLEANKEGFINIKHIDIVQPLNINGKRVVLPTDQQLKSFDPSDRIVFHPLCENILRGESEVINKLKEVINIRVNLIIGTIIQSLLQLVATNKLHSKLTPEQSEILTVIKEVDNKSVEEFTSIMLSTNKNQSIKPFFNIFLKRGGIHNDIKYSRLGVINFPFYDDLVDNKIDKPTRIKDKKALIAMFKFILPGIDDNGCFNYGSKSQVAPYLDALLMSTVNVASRLNDILILYNDYIDDTHELLFDSDWIEDFSDLELLIPEIRRIPIQAGNDGSLLIKTPQEEENLIFNRPVSQPVQVQPMQMQPMHMQPVQPEIKMTKRGIDFSSIKNVNPAIAYGPNPLARQLYTQQVPNQFNPNYNPPPSWAGGNNPMYPQQRYIPQQQMYPQQGYMPQQQGYTQQQYINPGII